MPDRPPFSLLLSRSVLFTQRWLLAIIASALLLLIGFLSLSELDKRIEVPSDYLRAENVKIFGEISDSTSLGELPSIMGFIEFRGFDLPPHLQDTVTGERTVALIKSERGSDISLIFDRLKPHRDARRKVSLALDGGKGIFVLRGEYLIQSSAPVEGLLLDRRSTSILSHDREFRNALRRRAKGEGETLFLRLGELEKLCMPQSGDQETILSILCGGVVYEEWKGEGMKTGFSVLQSRSGEGGRELSLSVPVAGGAPLQHSSPFSLFPLYMRNNPSLLFTIHTQDASVQLEELLSLLAFRDAGALLLLQGALQAAYENAFPPLPMSSTGALLQLPETLTSFLALFPDTPASFLLRNGTSGELQWLYALQTTMAPDMRHSLLQDARERFIQQFSPARVRRRTLPTGLTVEDIVSERTIVKSEVKGEQGYAVHILSVPHTEKQFVTAEKGTLILLSSSQDFLYDVIDVFEGGEAMGRSDPVPVHFRYATDAVAMSGPFFRRFAPLLIESALATSLLKLPARPAGGPARPAGGSDSLEGDGQATGRLSEDESLIWSRVPEKDWVRQVLVIP